MYCAESILQMEVDSEGRIVGSRLIITDVRAQHEDKYDCEITSDTIGFQTINTTYHLIIIGKTIILHN